MPRITLLELAGRYFHKKGYKLQQDITLEGSSGIPRGFDFLITRANEKHVVKVLDWKRTVGINMVINLDKASEDVGLKKPIIISGKFSSHAKAYSNRKAVTLLTKRELSRY